MKNWQSGKLGDFVTFKRGYDLPHRDRIHGNFPIVSSSGITGFHNKAKVKAPGVVTGRYGTLGEVFFITDDFWPLNTSLYVQKFHNVDVKFMFYYLKKLDFEGIASASAVPGINRNYLHKLKVKLPPLPTQKKIAAVLSAYDDQIENNTRRIALLERMAEELYKEWFVRMRFPGHESARFEKGIPEGWKMSKLKEFVKVNPKSIKKSTAPEFIEYIDIASVSTGKIEGTTTYSFKDAPSRARRIVKHGDVIYSCVRPNRRSFALISNPKSNTICSTGFAVLSPRNVPYTFLYYLVSRLEFAEYLSIRAKGAAYPAVNVEDFESAELLLPSKELLSKFNDIVDPMLSQKEHLLSMNENLKTTRDRLLTRLISGKLSVEELDIAFPPSMQDEEPSNPEQLRLPLESVAAS